MTNEIEKVYDPQKVEEKWYKYWLENKLFSSKPEPGRTPFTIVIPPPNVTGSLHMGHALNNTMQDIIIRFKRMQNYNVLWVPGTDHGGIATQNVVEKLLKAEGKSRESLGREKFIERMWQWRVETGDTILNQLKRLGCSLDWDRTRFTLDDVCSQAVRTAFVQLYDQGLIYRGNRLVNWCPRCHTALSDIEVEHEEEIGKLWHIQYPLKPEKTAAAGKKGKGAKPLECLVVATTRPETMLGDMAVAVHPDDERYKNLIGRMVILPLTGREIPIIADEAVDKAFGTGAVKVTPAHDPTDFEIAARHNLTHMVVIDFHGKMTREAGKYEGLDRYEARKQVLHALEEEGLLLETTEHPHAVGRCYRCNTAIEPLTSEQWFLKVEGMSKRAMQVVEEGKVKFYPESWKKPYLLWLENLRDWCISRQIWWGHRIPVYYCIPENKGEDRKEAKCPPIAAIDKPEKCPHCGNTHIVQDPDVLDTWFSSALWPFSVFKWPEENADLKYYYPTSVLATGHEILYLWVARMVQMGLQFRNEVPFREVYIHGIVRDKTGKKMSKSLGNVIDPLLIMQKFGTDALRFALTQSAAPGRDMQLADDSFVGARNFANKLWNASRFVMMNVQSVAWSDDFIMAVWPLELADKWILSEYRAAVRDVTAALERYDMDEAARVIYEFFWSKYCDWYIELAKIRINGTDEQGKKVVLSILMEILSGTLRMLHPVMPFITEEIWQSLAPYLRHAKGTRSIMQAPWPEVDVEKVDQNAIAEMRLVQDIVTAVRTIRSEMNFPPGKSIPLVVNAPKDLRAAVDRNRQYISFIARIDNLDTGEAIPRPAQSAAAVVAGMELFVPLAGLIDLDKEKQRLEKEIAGAEEEAKRCETKLSNENFVQRAPAKEVDRVRERLKDAQMKAERLKENLKAMG